MTTISKENGSSQGHGQLGNLRTLRSNTYNAATKLEKQIEDAKNKADAVTRAIGVKEIEMLKKQAIEQAEAQKAEEEKAARMNVTEVITATEVPMPEKNETVKAEAKQKSLKKAKTEPKEAEEVKNVSATVVEDKKPAVKAEKPVKKPREKSVEEKPAEAIEKKPIKQDKVELVGKVSVTEEVASKDNPNEMKRTYTDEKGNVKVRRFLTEIPKAPAKPQPRADQKSAGRPPFDRNRNSGFNNRDNNGQFRNNRPDNKDSQSRFAKDKDSIRDNKPKTFSKPSAPKFDFAVPPVSQGKQYGNKNKTSEKPDDKKTFNKKNLLMRTYDDYDDERDVVRKSRSGKKQESKTAQPIVKIDHAVINTEEVVIKDLSEKIGVSAAEIIKKLFAEGIIKTINDKIEFSIAEYIASMFNVTLTLKVKETAEETLQAGIVSADDNLPDNEKRPPIVTVMGHVDHGKTSLLDKIRKSNVTEGEAGGITQHIGAYQVKINGELITFIDTPGHEAFTAMRARGAQVTDVAIIVVAADDGVMPQTIEAINHAKAAEVPIIVAINKMDKPTANPEVVKSQLTEYGLVPEEWGGDNIMVNVSAKTGEGIKDLLESILVVAEVRELKANPEKKATGTVIEAKLDKGRGPVATVLVQNGTLHIGDYIVAGTAVGKVRAMFDSQGTGTKVAGPSMPVEILGFSDVPNAGDNMYCVDEKLAKQVADERKDKEKAARANASGPVSLDDLYSKISEGNMKNLNIIIKSDVQGSMEALKVSLAKISNEEVKVNPIHGGVGAITETDVMLAKASNAIIIGFNVRADNNAKVAAEKEGVDIRLYRIIYDAVDDITKAMKGMLAPKYKDTIIGQVTVREVFKISGVGAVAGAYVTSGKITRNAKIRLYRDNVMICDCNIAALRRFKDDVKEVQSGYECGVSLENYNDIKQNDVFEVYIVEEIQQ